MRLNIMYALIFWTIVGYAGTQSSTHKERDWRPLATFGMPNAAADARYRAACHEAARQLNLERSKYRCLNTQTGASE